MIYNERGVILMDELVLRLEQCGIPRITAECVCADLIARGKEAMLRAYVHLTEVLSA